MNSKNVVIATLMLVAIAFIIVLNPHTEKGSNEVSDVPVGIAGVPMPTELPSFKYSLVENNDKTINVPKEEEEAEATKKEIGKPVEVKAKKVIAKTVDSYPHYNIPLSKYMQSLIWDLCKKYKIDYELVLGIIRVESEFDHTVTSYDDSSRGLMQVNSRNTFYPFAKELGIKKPNVFNPRHNAMVGIYYLSTLRDAWDSKYTGKRLEDQMILSYRYGVAGSKRHSINSSYVKKVRAFQSRLEKGDFSGGKRPSI